MSVPLRHASGTGENDTMPRPIPSCGMKKEFYNNDKNMQAQGVFFTASKHRAAASAEEGF